MPPQTLPAATPELRRSDFALSSDQRDVAEVFATVFERECPSSRVRDSEPLGYDAALWQQLVDVGVLTMGVPEAHGGDGAGLVDLCLLAEAAGRRVAPVPLAEALVAVRLLAAVAAPQLGEAMGGAAPYVLAPTPQNSGPVLINGAAVAGGVVGLDGDDLVVVADRGEQTAPANLGGIALGWCDLASSAASTRAVIGQGPAATDAFARARDEWKVLTAASLVGLAEGALALAVDYAKERTAFGVPIGAFQAIAHPLADVRIAVEGARRMVQKAAWYLDHDPESAGAMASMAYLYAAETGNRAASVGIHSQGGLGFTLESDMQLYFRRAKSLVLPAGDPQHELLAIADTLYGPRHQATH